MCVFFFQAEDGIRDIGVTGVQTCALPICIIRMPMTAVISPPVTYEMSRGLRLEKSFDGETTLAAMFVVNCAAKMTAVAKRMTARLSKRAIRSTGFGMASP